MAPPTKNDCEKRIPQLLSLINNANAEIPKIRADMAALGFGTAAQLKLVTKMFVFVKVVGDLPPLVLGVTADFVKCNDAALAKLDADQLKGLVRALHAHAELVVAGIPETVADQTPEQVKLLAAFTPWLQSLNDIKTQFPMASADTLMMLLKAAKKKVNTASPVVLKLLMQVFGKLLLEAIANGAIEDPLDRKALIKKLAEKVLISALGKKVAEKVVPYLDSALVGWELLVELAGNSAIKDVREYVDQLLMKLILLMMLCKWGWRQKQGNVPYGNLYYGFAVAGEKYKKAAVVARAFIRCGLLVDGKPVFSGRCPVMFTNGMATVEVTLTEEIKVGGKWIVMAAIDMKSVQNSPCITGANFCYAYLELSFTLADGTETSTNLITGVQTFP